MSLDEAAQLKGFLGDYLQQKGVRLTKPFRCLNPDHEDRHPSMSYHRKSQTVHCFSCGVTYDIFDLVAMDYGLSTFPEKVNKVAELFGAATPPQRVSAATPERKTRDGELAVLQAQATGSTEYFQSRGIGEELCRRYGLFQDQHWAYMPLFSGGHCIGWCARNLTEEGTPRYKNANGPIGIWNGDLLSREGEGRGEPLFVTEGIINALTLEQLGYQAVALCGCQNTAKFLTLCQEHVATAAQYRFISCGDDDAGGHQMDKALLEGLDKLGLSGRPLGLSGGDINHQYLAEPKRLTEAIERVLEDAEAPDHSAAASLAFFFSQDAKERPLSTGFEGLDTLLDGGLYSGLYVLGAISSVGKTSFALQLADNIAAGGGEVLFFSLEQSKFELLAKSISRISAQLEGKPRRLAFTARQLLGGTAMTDPARGQLLERCRGAYARLGAGLFIREGIADIGTAEIREAVQAHIARRGKKPVVVVDYLQILRPGDARATDKQNTDRAVVELKRISRDFGIPVLAVSSFNRENYRNAVSMEAFKESGAVEYSSDVLFGMQLTGAGEPGFDVNVAKTKEPRAIELVMLKNRNGVPYAKVKFAYAAKYHLFEEK